MTVRLFACRFALKLCKAHVVQPLDRVLDRMHGLTVAQGWPADRRGDGTLTGAGLERLALAWGRAAGLSMVLAVDLACRFRALSLSGP